jgi:NADH:ubiquinone oxidoreductase subunit 6 (subunit J)
MSPTITVIRCIGTEFARRLLYPIAIIASILLTLMVVGVLLLGTLSSWWLLLLIPVVMVLCIVGAVLTITWLTIRLVTPTQTKTQRQAVKIYVDKLQRLSDAVQTPKVILLFHIVRDVAAPRKDGFISSITDDTASLKRDFQQLQKLF